MPFASLGLPDAVTRGVRAAGYTEPTPVQIGAIPLILPGHDLVAAAQTGTGKTAAFILPILARLLEGERALRALVLVPTRELAAQVEDAARTYAKHTGVRVGCVYGGVPIGPQERMLRHQGVELLVATPGRLLDLNGRQSVSLEDIEVLVLDEADRMVDMGFAPDLRRILKLLPTKRQTLMFSATMPAELNKVAAEALKNPRRLDLAPPTRPTSQVEQTVCEVPRARKTALLEALLDRLDDHTAIVFVRTKHGADRLARRLSQSGNRVAAIHGDRSQGQRERALRDFKNGRVHVLVATDIASRGIDVDDITHVINFDVPRAAEDYVHRVGRTGRMQATGSAITLVSPEELKDFTAIERAIGTKVPRARVAGFDLKAKDGEGGEHEGSRHRNPRNRERHSGFVEGRSSREPAAGRNGHGRPSSGPANGAAGRGGHARPSSAPASGAAGRTGHARPASTSADGMAADANHGRRPRSGASDRRSRKRM